jgi:excisionase family DNA binding protein
MYGQIPPNLVRLLLTPKEAASALAISERTLWELTKRSVIPCVRIGRAVRYDLVDLQSWIERQKTGGEQENKLETQER